MNQLFKFFFVDEKLRRKVYVTAGGASLIYGLVNLWAFNRDEKRVFSETAFLLVFLILGTGIYAVARALRGRGFARESVPPYQLPRVSLKLVIAGLCATAFLTNMLRIDIPNFQASLADFSLRRIARQMDTVQAATLSPEQLEARFQRVGSIVANSSASQIPVDSDTLKITQSALSRYLTRRPLPDQAVQIGWATTIDLQVFALKRDIATGVLFPRTLPEEAYVFNSPVQIDRDVYFQGEHSTLVVNDQIGIKGASVTFDKIDFKSSWNPLVLKDDRARALVSNSTFQAGAQVLDRIIWVNVRFENAMILYNEGPLRLRNVTFKNCDLRNLQMPFHEDEELLRRIQDANGQPFTFVYEPTTPRSEAAPAKTK